MSVISRRAVLAGACGTCAVAVAGCTTYGSAPISAQAPAPAAARSSSAATPPAEPADGSGDVAAEPEDGEAASEGSSGAASGGLAATADIPVGGGKIFADQDLVVTQPTRGTFKAFSATCTHAGCAVNEVADGEISCPCHGSTFAVADGSVTGGPAPEPLPARKIKVSDGSISLA